MPTPTDDPLDLDGLVSTLDAIYLRLQDAPTAVRAEGVARLYRVLKIMVDTAQEARAEALYDYLVGLYIEEVLAWNAALADDPIPNVTPEPPADLLGDDDLANITWLNRIRMLSGRPTFWTLRLGGRSYECFTSPSEVFRIASRIRDRRILVRKQEAARAARAARAAQREAAEARSLPPG